MRSYSLKCFHIKFNLKNAVSSHLCVVANNLVNTIILQRKVIFIYSIPQLLSMS
jgi:hypothetical protein